MTLSLPTYLTPWLDPIPDPAAVELVIRTLRWKGREQLSGRLFLALLLLAEEQGDPPGSREPR